MRIEKKEEMVNFRKILNCFSPNSTFTSDGGANSSTGVIRYASDGVEMIMYFREKGSCELKTKTKMFDRVTSFNLSNCGAVDIVCEDISAHCKEVKNKQ